MKYKISMIAIIAIAVVVRCSSLESTESMAAAYNALSNRIQSQLSQVQSLEQLDAELSAYFAKQLQNAGFDLEQAAIAVRDDMPNDNPELYAKLVQFMNSNVQKANEYISQKVSDLVLFMAQN